MKIAVSVLSPGDFAVYLSNQNQNSVYLCVTDLLCCSSFWWISKFHQSPGSPNFQFAGPPSWGVYMGRDLWVLWDRVVLELEWWRSRTRHNEPRPQGNSRSTWRSLFSRNTKEVLHRDRLYEWEERPPREMSGSKRLPCQKEACAIQKCLQGNVEF